MVYQLKTGAVVVVRQNIIPSSLPVQLESVGKIITSVKTVELTGMAFRVPTPDVSPVGFNRKLRNQQILRTNQTSN